MLDSPPLSQFKPTEVGLVRKLGNIHPVGNEAECYGLAKGLSKVSVLHTWSLINDN